MSRPTGRYREAQGQDEGAPRRYARKKSGNEGIYIALGAAAIVGVVALLIFSGSSSGGALADESKAFLRQVFEVCLTNRQAEGIPMMDPVEILRDQNADLVKTWRSLPPERQKDLSSQAFKSIRGWVIGMNDLNLASMSQVDTILASADYHVTSADDRVDVEFQYLGSRWNAICSKRSGKWQLHRLDRLD